MPDNFWGSATRTGLWVRQHTHDLMWRSWNADLLSIYTKHLVFPQGCSCTMACSFLWNAFWSLVLIALVSFSRIFLGVHFASDVAAGLLVGSFWLLVAFTLAEYLRQRGAPG